MIPRAAERSPRYGDHAASYRWSVPRRSRRVVAGASPWRCSTCDAASRPLLLRDRDRDPLAPLGTAAAEDFTTAAGLLAGSEPLGALAALIMWLIGTLHGVTPPCGEGDRYSSAA